MYLNSFSIKCELKLRCVACSINSFVISSINITGIEVEVVSLNIEIVSPSAKIG